MTARFYVGSLSEMTPTASIAAAAGFPVENLLNYIPGEKWKSGANTNGQTLTLDFGSARPRNFLILHNSNFSGMTTVTLTAAHDSGFASGVVTVSSDIRSPLSIYKLEFTAVSRRYWRINFTNTNSVTPELGQVFIDQKFDAQHAYDFPYEPDNENFESNSSSVSLSGIRRSSRLYAGRMLWNVSFKIRNNQFRYDWQWFMQKVQGSHAPFYFYNHLDDVRYMFIRDDLKAVKATTVLVNDVVSVVMQSLDVNQNPMTMQIRAMAVDLDGSTEYASKSSPVNLDMNGSEIISDSDNRDFETDLGNWTGSGNHSVLRITSDFHSGTACMQVTATGAGVAGNHAPCFGSQFSVTIGKTYTLEFWAKSVSGDTTLAMRSFSAAFADGQLLGTKTITTSWAKYVFNFVATAASVNMTTYLAGAGVCLLDDISFTESYSAVIAQRFKTSSATAQRITRAVNAGGTAFWYTEVTAGGTLFGSFQSSSGNQANISSANGQADGAWRSGILVWNRTTNLAQWYVNGVASGSAVDISGIGKLNDITSAFHIGWNTAAAYFNGQLGEIQVSRKYAWTAAQCLDIHTKGIFKSYDQTEFPNAQVVAHYRWRGVTDADFLKDETGWNNLTGTGVTQADDQVADVSYPITELYR